MTAATTEPKIKPRRTRTAKLQLMRYDNNDFRHAFILDGDDLPRTFASIKSLRTWLESGEAVDGIYQPVRLAGKALTVTRQTRAVIG